MHPATLWENIADRLGDAPAVIEPGRTCSWHDLEANAAHLAGALEASGVGPGAKVAAYLYNGAEYLETYFAALKLRAQPVNVNYRYVEAELTYLLDNADARALVYHSSLAARVAAIDTSRLDLLVQVADSDDPIVAGAQLWDRTLTDAEPASRCPRSDDDHHLLYTGGTTGIPKGVVYEIGGLTRELLTMAAPFIGGPAPTNLDEAVRLAVESRERGQGLVTLVLPPLMHGTGMALAFLTLNVGGTVVLAEPRRFDPVAALRTIEAHRVSVVCLVGDAFARPMAAALDAAQHSDRPFDLSSVRVIMSSGAMLAAETKAALLRHTPAAMVIDTLAASEGSMGVAVTHPGSTATTAAFALRPGTKVFDDHDREVLPGSEVAGRVGVAATNPVGYYKDPVKTAATFRTVDGTRYTFPGDWATVEADGTITLLGRGSHCINTGGEKVFPEEVEEALKTHPAVTDALVFGVEDDQWGQRIEAVASVTEPVETAAIVEHVRARLAAYKAPKTIHLVDVVPRAPNGKADYTAARRLAAPEEAPA